MTDTPDRTAASDEIDITTEVCPMTFVRTRLALDRLQPGAILRVRLCGDEPWRNVVRNAVALGHTVITDEGSDGGQRLVTIRKNPGRKNPGLHPPGA